MDEMGLGASTRRRFSQILGGLSLSLLGLSDALESEARRRDKKNDRKKRRKRKNKKRKRCVKATKSCSQTGTSCCKNLECEDFGRPTGFRCCKPSGYGCSNDRDTQCCPGLECVDGVCAFEPMRG